MGFNFIRKKSEEMGRKPISSFLKINKYEDPQMALDLVAHICTSAADLSVSDSYDSFRKSLAAFRSDEHFGQFCDRTHLLKSQLIDSGLEGMDRLNLFIGKSIDDIVNHSEEICSEAAVTQEETNAHSSIKIVVCGGYSSGKSSFLNSITGIGSVLPTGIEPVSMVNTYISVSDDVKCLCVRGKNIKRDWVLLDSEVLDCIQHSSTSKVHVASVLDELYLYVPIPKGKEYLKNMTFIDTPGYNNSDDSNAENKSSDKDTALKAVANADVVLWCIDIEAGTISRRDIEILNSIDSGKPVVIIFNKMDKKSSEEVSAILGRAKKVCASKLNVQPLTLVAYSRETPEIVVTESKNELVSSLFACLNERVGLSDDKESYAQRIGELFVKELSESDAFLKNCYKLREDLIREKDKESREKRANRGDSKDTLSKLKEILLDDYDNLQYANDCLRSLVGDSLKGWRKALNREDEWRDKVGFFSDASSVSNRAQKGIECYKDLVEQYDDLEKPLYRDVRYRKELFKAVNVNFDEVAGNDAAGYTLIQDKQKDVTNAIISLQKYIEFLTESQDKVISSFKQCYDNASDRIRRCISTMQEMHTEKDNDIFSAIANDNMPRFLNCFSLGVDLTNCNSQGYSPMTYAVRCR